jgi:hypothetical protein
MVGPGVSWGSYSAAKKRLVYANTDGQLYTHASEAANGADFEAWRQEPILDFGNKRRRDLLEEIWFDIVGGGDFSIDAYHRGGNTAKELTGAAWEALDSVSCNDPDKAVIYLAKSNRLHQIQWGTDRMNETSSVNGITFRYSEQSEH